MSALRRREFIGGAAALIGSTAMGLQSVHKHPGSTVPPAIAGLGYSLVSVDEFTSFDTSYWLDYWYASGSPATPYGTVRPSPWPAGTVFSDGSIARFQSTAANDYPRLGATTRRSTKLGSSAWQYGYFECSLNWTGVTGAWPAFWLSGLDHTFDATAMNPEIDIFEGYGSIPTKVSGTIHKNTGGANGVADATNAGNFTDTGSTVAGSYHKYAALWTPTTVSWYLDDTLLRSASVYTTTNQLMVMYINMDISNASNFGVLSNVISGTETALIESAFDYVRVWQDSNGLRQ